jgi:hypothetical protein
MREIKMPPELDDHSQRIEDLRRQVSDLIAELPAEALDLHPSFWLFFRRDLLVTDEEEIVL